MCELKYKLQPWNHQLKAIEEASHLPHYALFFSMGTGKSCASINMLRWKFYVNKRMLRVLVLAPPITLENWKREFKMHSHILEHRITILYGNGKKRISLFEQKAYENEKEEYGHIFITNYETLYMKDLYEKISAWQPEAIIFDESHKLKDIKSKRTKLAIPLADFARYKYILTGTPVLNSPMDLFSQFRILDGGKTFGTNFFVFRAQYFWDKNAGMPKQKYFPDWRIREDSLVKISQKIKAISSRVKKEDCLDLPPLIRKVYYVDLAPEQEKLYNSMKKSFIAFVNDKACTAELALTRGLRLQQIASGYLKMEDGSEITLKDNPRANALKDLLEEICVENKVLVWCCFKQNYEQVRGICERLNIKYVEVHGEVSEKNKFKNVDDFNNDPSIRVLIGHPASAGIGINLVSASYSIFFTRGFNLGDDMQAESRNHRGGSEIHSKITRIDLVAKSTIDEYIQECLARKEVVSEKVLINLSNKL